jgi:hypothetical protein
MAEGKDTLAERRSISLYPSDWAIVQAHAERLGVGVSTSIRLIVREWNDLRKTANTNGAPPAGGDV